MNDQVDCVVIGAGVIGLAVARALAESGRQVVVIERNANIGEETSSRNSEVIHAGLYYPTGSLKATLCTQGKALLYAYCDRKQVPYRRCGKLIVAPAEAQREQLARIVRQAGKNGVDDLVEVDTSGLSRYEPEISAVAALWSPSTGIVDSHALMLALEADLEQADGLIAKQTTVDAIAVHAGAIRLGLSSQGEQSELSARTVINAAGLGAAELAAASTGTEHYTAPHSWLAKGNYFHYGGACPFNSLVYPLPVAGGLGIHATLDLGGGLRFGPDVEWIDRVDYSVDASRGRAFAQAIRSYWPEVDESALVPDYAGIRPKLAGPGEPAADFRIDVVVPGTARQLVHLLGMESPGLTSTLAIAELVAGKLADAVKA